MGPQNMDPCTNAPPPSMQPCSAAAPLSPPLHAAMRFTSNVAQGVQRMLSGCTDVDPQQHGLTSDEERAAARLVQVRGADRGAV